MCPLKIKIGLFQRSCRKSSFQNNPVENFPLEHPVYVKDDSTRASPNPSNLDRTGQDFPQILQLDK